eukprot:gene5541-8923_t
MSEISRTQSCIENDLQEAIQLVDFKTEPGYLPINLVQRHDRKGAIPLIHHASALFHKQFVVDRMELDKSVKQILLNSTGSRIALVTEDSIEIINLDLRKSTEQNCLSTSEIDLSQMRDGVQFVKWHPFAEFSIFVLTRSSLSINCYNVFDDMNVPEIELTLPRISV